MSHALTRTSPKGGSFIGKCIKCGIEDIPLSKIHEECVNPSGLSNTDSLMIMIKSIEK